MEGVDPPESLVPVLHGSLYDCHDIAVDSETGNILVSAVDGSNCTVTEIDPTLQQAFQFFDQDDLGGVAEVLTTYRNPQGPPDDTSGVA